MDLKRATGRQWLPSSQASQDLPIQQILPSVLEHCESTSADLVLQVESLSWSGGLTKMDHAT
jgi:hypothetical protein